MRIHFLLFFLLTSIYLCAQEKKDSLEKSKKSNFGFGFFIEGFVSHSSVKQSLVVSDPKASSLTSLGFALGYGLFFELNKKVELRALPGIIFQEDRLKYSNSIPFDTLAFKPTTLFLPLHLTFKPFGKKIYFLGGTSSYIDISRGKKSPVEVLFFRRFNQSLDIGLGYLLKAKKFDFMPEFRYSHGMLNLAGDKRTYYGEALGGYYRHRISLVFVFD